MDPQLTAFARRFLLTVVPQSARALARLRRQARRIPDDNLRREALASIALKDFHVHGGCILATFLPQKQAQHYIELVATFETAVDYLDNLCDRAGFADEEDFRALHEALVDAVTPAAPLRSYFRARPSDDGGYLAELVRSSQRLFAALPSFDVVQPLVAETMARYCELQAIKHLPRGEREARCAEVFGSVVPGLRWWESAAACGSTLPTFALAYGAISGCDTARALELYQTYFPSISAFHILLDYFIDQQEDREHGELNFVAEYGGAPSAREGIARIGRSALERARSAGDAAHHTFAVRAMCAFYCSRRKVRDQGLSADASAIARSVDVDLVAQPWQSGKSPILRPLLSLYERVIR